MPLPSVFTVTVCSAGAALAIVIDSSFVSLPALFSALTVNLAVPSVVGVPLISPVFSFRLSPAGSLPLSLLHVMGASTIGGQDLAVRLAHLAVRQGVRGDGHAMAAGSKLCRQLGYVRRNIIARRVELAVAAKPLKVAACYFRPGGSGRRTQARQSSRRFSQ